MGVQAAVSSARNYRSRGPGTGHKNARDRRNLQPAECPHRGHGRGLLRGSGRAPHGKPSGPEGPLGVADSLPPAVRIRKSPPRGHPPAKARRERLCDQFRGSGFLPVFWPSARSQRGWVSAFRVKVKVFPSIFSAAQVRRQGRKNATANNELSAHATCAPRTGRNARSRIVSDRMQPARLQGHSRHRCLAVPRPRH
jgi:hypothetical protein